MAKSNGSFMRAIIAFMLSVLFLAMPVYSHEVTVGIPSLGNEYARNDYIISQDNGIIAGIVSQGITKNKDVSGDYTTLTQDSAGNKFYVLFTRGTQENLETRAKYLMDNTFERFYSPSFGFELKTKNNIQIKAVYDTLDITGTLRLMPGSYNLIIRYERLSGGIPEVSIRKSD